MNTTATRPFTASTDKFAYAQAFSGSSARRAPNRVRHSLTLRSLGIRRDRRKSV